MHDLPPPAPAVRKKRAYKKRVPKGGLAVPETMVGLVVKAVPMASIITLEEEEWVNSNDS